jgi:hypothetical protein
MQVWVALITGAFSLGGIALASLLQLRNLRAENTAQHGESRQLLGRLDERSKLTLDRVERVAHRLDDHLEDHHRVEGKPVSSDNGAE